MTEEAANKVLNAAEKMQPLQDNMRRGANAPDERGQAWCDHPGELDQARVLVDDTRAVLREASTKTQVSQDCLMEIIMAQDFQDLTGQVIMKMLGVVGVIESELVQVLLDSVPAEKRSEATSLLNGPQISPQGRVDVVTSKDQVDDLLSNLGF